MKKSVILILSGFALVFASCVNKPSPAEPMVVAYISGYRNYDFSKIEASSLTHINYAFANIIDGEVKFGSEAIDDTKMNADDILALTALKKINPDLKVLVSVGGWGWSGNFSDAALTDSSRNRFGASAARFIKEYSIDGIDIDWEYPNHPGAGNRYRPEDVHNFTLLLECVRKHIDSLAVAERGRNKYLLTIATGATELYAANTELGPLSQYLDFINIMTYDLHHGGSYQTGHHANLWLSTFDASDGDAADKAVSLHLKAGVPASKLNIGIPFYGRAWKGVEPVGNGLYRQAATTGAGIPYTEVLKALTDPAFTRYFDSTAASPFLWNERDSVFISYEDEVSIPIRMKYIRDKGIGGVMFWEYTEDVDGMLLQAITEGIKVY